MFELDLYLRVFAFSQLLLITAQAQQKAKLNLNFSLVAGYSVCASAYLFISPLWDSGNRGWLVWAASLVSAMIPILLLLLANMVFFRLALQGFERILVAIYFMIAVMAHLEIIPPVTDDTLGLKVMMVAGAMLSVLILSKVVRNWKLDLVERRRKLRLAVALLILFGLIGWYILALLEIQIVTPKVHSLFESIAIAVGAFSFNLIDWRGKNSILMPFVPHVNPQGKDKKCDELTTLMEEGKLYLESELNMAILSQTLRISEKALRKLIHQKLGAENFNDFLNSYRVKEAAKGLKESDAKILDIAFEVGFSSLAPFNRAFKKEYGVTPSLYRKESRPAA